MVKLKKTKNIHHSKVLNILPQKKIKNAWQPLLFIHSTFVPCKCEIVYFIDKKTMKPKEEKNDEIKYNDLVELQITPLKPLTLDMFSDWKSLGRFILRDGSSRHVAVGRVNSIMDVSKILKPIDSNKKFPKPKPQKKPTEIKSDKQIIVEDGIWSKVKFNEKKWEEE